MTRIGLAYSAWEANQSRILADGFAERLWFGRSLCRLTSLGDGQMLVAVACEWHGWELFGDEFEGLAGGGFDDGEVSTVERRNAGVAKSLGNGDNAGIGPTER